MHRLFVSFRGSMLSLRISCIPLAFTVSRVGIVGWEKRRLEVEGGRLAFSWGQEGCNRILVHRMDRIIFLRSKFLAKGNLDEVFLIFVHGGSVVELLLAAKQSLCQCLCTARHFEQMKEQRLCDWISKTKN